MNKAFKAILITGARQVGKTTMLKHLAAQENRTFVSMDDPRNRDLAKTDPKLFFQIFKPPILIDEAQKAPELFEYIKLMCDEAEENGLFWLTGSESKRLLKEAGDSLAGRICILRMYSLSQREKYGLIDVPAFQYEFEALTMRQQLFEKNNIDSIYEHIWRGGMPGTLDFDEEQLYEYYSSYIDTYLMRDAVDDNGITDTVGFRKVLTACASFIGKLINYSDIANAGDVSVPTAKSWVKILQNMGIVFLLETYSNNELKRLVKTPKLYFCDTGLAAYLSRWTSKNVLMNGAASGHYFENYVVGEFLRYYSYGDTKANMTYYRDTNQKEIDVVVEEGGVLHPIEIKRSSNPEKKLVKAFGVLNVSDYKLGTGLVICMTDRVFPIDESNIMVPANII
ncbi:MAG: ATP-binding protein [Lachnospiraceae bacterium]|nr:ATP-binding protein [Lachnospiraceae bacterium]